jgi:hypothetical protein
VAEGYRRLHNEELHNFYASPYVIRVIRSRMRWAGHVTGMESFGRKTWRRPLGNPRSRCEDNIKMDLGKIGWEVVDWIHLARDREIFG